MSSTYLLGRLMQALLTLLVVTALVFGVVRASGDVVAIMAPLDATAEDLVKMRQDLGLDDPVPVQFVRYLGHAVQGDLGISLRSREPAVSLVFDRLPATVELGLASMFVALLIGIPIGVLSAVRRNSLLDVAGRFLALTGQAVPQFWLGIILILVFAVQLGWLPSGGRTGPESVILPAFALGWYSAASVMRLMRSAMLDIMDSDYIVFARSRGISERRLVWRHAFRNAVLPVITLIGIQLGYLLAGAVAIEAIYAWPGMGKLLLDAILARDYAVVQAAVLISATIIVILNFLVDVGYVFIDPRLRLR